MHPTPDEQLRAVLRLVDGASADPGLAEETKAALVDAGRLIRRLERSWSARLPFLTVDNELAAELLADLAPLLPSLQNEIEAAVGAPEPRDEPTAHAANKRFQDLLGRAVHLLPDDPSGDDGRARIVAHLRSRLAADPALNRTPADRLSADRSSPEDQAR